MTEQKSKHIASRNEKHQSQQMVQLLKPMTEQNWYKNDTAL
jgi:hypothetical protein